MGQSGSPPQPPSPGASATAAAGSNAAGTAMDIANAPVAGYANAYTSGMINPYTSALNTALSNRSALTSAQAQRAIQSQVDPAAFNSREMMMQSANQRLGRLYGVNPTSASYSAPGAFSAPPVSALPDLSAIGAGSAAIAKNLSTPIMDKNTGAFYGLNTPGNFTNVPAIGQVMPNNYLYQ